MSYHVMAEVAKRRLARQLEASCKEHSNALTIATMTAMAENDGRYVSGLLRQMWEQLNPIPLPINCRCSIQPIPTHKEKRS